MSAVPIDSKFFNHDAQAGGFFPVTHINPGFDIDSYISGPGQNMLVEGIRGTGKTHVLKMIASKCINSYPEKKILPVYLSLAKFTEWQDSDIRLFRIQLYANIVSETISTIENNKGKIGSRKEGFEKALENIKNMFGVKSDDNIDSILSRIKEINEDLLSKLTYNPERILEKQATENTNKASITSTSSVSSPVAKSTVQLSFEQFKSLLQEQSVQFVGKNLAYENAAGFIISFFKELKSILGCKYTILLLDECSEASHGAQVEIFRLLKLVRGTCTEDMQTNYVYFFASVYPSYATSYPPSFEPGQDAGVEYLQLDELSDEYEAFFYELTKKRLELVFDKSVISPIEELFENDKAFYLAAYGANGIPRRYFEILKQSYSTLCQRADSDSINQKISLKDVGDAIQTVASNQILSQNKLTNDNFSVIEYIIKRISQRNKKIETENKDKEKPVPANVYFTINRSQYDMITPLLLQGCLHDKGRTRLKKYYKEDGSQGPLIMLDLSLAYQGGAILRQKAVAIFRNDLKVNAKDGYSSCQDILFQKHIKDNMYLQLS
ncbi:MAG: hypothetical protein Q8J68_07670 [Methanolobus sp.]|uniref:hypothetical protein n=1 Tax=Methanolobus sp. TaxID=1874737 RepID=UPI0027309407|nr:hypothetical protein [Methanolobus sp.]MDP2217145.1 hypothetical protein [Methanolobus sp.]